MNYKKVLFGVACAMFCFVGCSNNNEEKPEQNEKIEQEKGSENYSYEIEWKDKPEKIEGSTSVSQVGEAKIVTSDNYGKILVINFTYINNSDEARDFINDFDVKPRAFQNGRELEYPGNTSEEGKYSYTDAYKDIKSGGTIETELVWELEDTKNIIELDMGMDGDYNPLSRSTIKIKNSDDYKRNFELEELISDYSVSWKVDMKELENNGRRLVVNKMGVRKSEYGDLLILEITYTNNTDRIHNLINDYDLRPKAFQNGIELDVPGITSEMGVYNYAGAFKSLKNGGRITTQMVFVLENTEDSVEIEFGSNIEPIFVNNVIFK